MDESKSPKGKMSAEYVLALLNATTTLDELTPKFFASIPITPAEGTRLLNANWTLYLHALASRDIREAKDTMEFIDLISAYLKLLGYRVIFTDKYCVTPLNKGETN